MDLTLVPLEELPLYLSSDKLLRILLDKDGRVLCKPEPTDEDYWIKRPTPACVDDCCNEFWLPAPMWPKGCAGMSCCLPPIIWRLLCALNCC